MHTANIYHYLQSHFCEPVLRNDQWEVQRVVHTDLQFLSGVVEDQQYLYKEVCMYTDFWDVASWTLQLSLFKPSILKCPETPRKSARISCKKEKHTIIYNVFFFNHHLITNEANLKNNIYIWEDPCYSKTQERRSSVSLVYYIPIVRSLCLLRTSCHNKLTLTSLGFIQLSTKTMSNLRA